MKTINKSRKAVKIENVCEMEFHLVLFQSGVSNHLAGPKDFPGESWIIRLEYETTGLQTYRREDKSDGKLQENLTENYKTTCTGLFDF